MTSCFWLSLALTKFIGGGRGGTFISYFSELQADDYPSLFFKLLLASNQTRSMNKYFSSFSEAVLASTGD
jgi:hypothetical protein